MALPPAMEQELFYWHREGRNTNAEVDYVIQVENSIVLVEVTSGLRGSMQSMRIFIEELKTPFGMRLLQENVSHYENIRSLPLYLAANCVGKDAIGK